MVFSPVKYVPTTHVKDRFTDRIGSNKFNIQDLVRRGQVILDTGSHRYIKSGNLRFPCIKDDEDGCYVIKSVITPEMHMKAK